MASTRKKNSDKNQATITSHSNKNINPDQTCDIHSFMKQHPFLSKLLRNDGVLFECDGEAPSPSKDYGQLQISLDKVILRWWKITLRNIEGSMYPGEIKDSFEEFYYDEIAQREIWRIFGQATLNHCINIVCGRFDWLTYLPLNVQIHILSYINLDDIPQISLVSKALRTLCRHNDLWRIFYVHHYGRHALENKELIHLAERRGWRHVFFTNRLKLQMQLRRQAQLEHHHPEDPLDLVKARERRSKLQPSPPSTPRQQKSSVQPSIRRHSFATRKGSPRASPLPDYDESAYIGGMGDSPRTRRPPSPSLSIRTNAGSVASSSSAQPPVQPPHRSTTRH